MCVIWSINVASGSVQEGSSYTILLQTKLVFCSAVSEKVTVQYYYITMLSLIYSCNCFVNNDDWLPQACMKNGTCSDMVSRFNCICITVYTGIICDVEIMECTSNPCYNNGTCKDILFVIACLDMYTLVKLVLSTSMTVTPILVVAMEVSGVASLALMLWHSSFCNTPCLTISIV